MKRNEIVSSYKVSIIPEPVKIILEKEIFTFNEKTVIFTDLRLKKIAELLKKFLAQATSLNPDIEDLTQIEKKNNVVTLRITDNENNLKHEGYDLKVSRNCIDISALTPRGIFYGIQTLRQLFPPEIESLSQEKLELSIPCVIIEDFPRFTWRGFMLDEARHFFGKDVVKKVLDLMAFLKLNIFHWHLTDDQGWRIEIKKYPLLTEVGSKRKGTFISKRKGINGIPVSGYYSQEDLKEIISYAAERFITIIPEIDFPGHSTAILASYPELSCIGGPFEVSTRFGIHKEVLCVGKEKVFEFVQNVLNEVMNIFPSEIIHIGGDEVPKRRWHRCPDCQNRMKDEGLETEEDLQVYFTNKIADYITSHGRNLVGWNEILNENLDKNAICQYWTYNFDKVLEHLRMGRNVVMSELNAVYLNFPYNLLPLRKTYMYDPIPNELEQKFYNQILGIEACLWTEYIPKKKRLEWHTFPRLIAVAEIGWTPKEKKNLQSFLKRLDSFLKRLDFHEINYASKDDFEKDEVNS